MTFLLSQMDFTGSVHHLCQCFKHWDLSSFWSSFGKGLFYTCRLRNTELQIHETKSQVEKFSNFLHMGRCKSQSSLKFNFLGMNLSHLGPVILYSEFPQFSSVQFSSVAQSCPILCNPMNRSTPGLPVHHQLPEFTQTHVHQVGVAIQPSHPLSSPSPPAPNPSQLQSLSQWVNTSHEVAKVLEFQL